ncbi:MAG: glutamine-hydrolyzing carbamoyl-phosphate synthase small subunit [Cyclobacteriaceae bacterium]|nr:glutamine-hydrolyzing carbamoyl-phosphate synthase small subunit [Cyclobacteriaceae bacterium]
MKYQTKEKAVLILEDGTYFYGYSIGKKGTSGGEICFNTGMTGYQEIYTDPSYYGQVVVNTTSHIGNYGVKGDEQESSEPKISGLVVNDYSGIHSRFLAESSLQEYLEKNNIVGISNLDTRRIVRHIRSKGAMNCLISSEILDPQELRNKLAKLPSMNGLELSSLVSTKSSYFYGDASATYRVAALDIGIKASILKNLVGRDCYIQVFPAKTSFAEMEQWNPDGYFLSNGPGDPAVMDYAVDTVKEILKAEKPLFGICLGHQLLGRANGISTYKMHHGHRGLNHPIKNLESGLCEITSQNHGFCISREDAEANKEVEITHINLNDNTIAGIRIKNKPAFSVQYHPESSPGPHDSRYLFDTFIKLMSNK